MSVIEEIREGFYLSEEGEWIPDGWEKYSLDELTTKIGSGATPTGGKDAYKQEGITLIRSQNILDLKFSPNGLAYIDDAQAQKLSNVVIEENDVLINITGDSVARVCKVPSKYLPARVNQHVAIIRADRNKSEPKFLEYLLVSRDIKGALLGLASAGATRNALSKTILESFNSVIPPLPEQKAIAAVLGSLDDKIELLREQNDTLETLAQTLFKRWFIDFNFPDKNGKPYKDNGGNMTPSELGEIPEGWRVGKLGEIINSSRSNVKTSDIKDDEKYVGLEHISKKHLQLTEWGNGGDVSSNKARFNLGDILFGKLRPYFHKVAIAPFDGICSTDILVLNPISEKWFSYSLMQVYSERLIEFVTLASTGTRMPRASFDHLSSYLVVLPCNELADSFNEVCLPLFNKARTNTQQIQTLTNLRDTLLPKLMKGEIRIK